MTGNSDHTAGRISHDSVMAQRFLAALMVRPEGEACAEMRIFRATWEKHNVVPCHQYSKTIGGWYATPSALAADAGRVRKVSAFVTVNPVKQDLWARSADRLMKLPAGGGTSDEDIVCLSWLYIDIDSKRPAEVSATGGELAAAVALRDKILDGVDGLRESAIYGSSGNGGWILARLDDLPNDQEHRGVVATALTVLAAKFNNESAFVDVKTRNPSRVMVLPGTLKCKGSDVPARPYRMATVDGGDPVPPPFALAGWLKGQGATWFVPAPAPRPAAAQGEGGASAVKRAAAYVAGMAPAVSGQNGHSQAFDAAQALVVGFDLPVSDARPILKAFSDRCEPPWSDAELEHKLEDADKLAGERGALLKGDDSRRFKIAVDGMRALADPAAQEGGGGGAEDIPEDHEDNPHRLARLFLAVHGTVRGMRGIYFWNGEFWVWISNRYRISPEKEIRGRISAFVAREFQALYARRLMTFGASGGEGKPPALRKVTTRLVSDVAQALMSMCALSPEECPSQPAAFGSVAELGWSPDDVLATATELINVRAMIAGVTPARLPSTPDFFAASRLDYDFDEDAPDPVNWLTLLGTMRVTDSSPVQYQIWPEDPDSIATLQEWFGLHLLGDISYEKIFALIGPPRSGKGTIAAVLSCLVGQENIAGPTLESLADKFGLEPMIGKRAAIIDDARPVPSDVQSTIAERLLSVSGRGQLTVPRKFRSAWTGRIPAKITLMSNMLPKLGDDSGALPSRFVILKMTKSMVGREDNRLVDKILPEMPGILRWSFDGLKRLYARGRFVQPDSGSEMVHDLGSLSSPIKLFSEERCLIAAGGTVACSALYTAWRDWCGEHGRREPGDSQTFGRNLRSIVPNLKTIRRTEFGQQVRCYQGVCLLAYEPADDVVPYPANDPD